MFNFNYKTFWGHPIWLFNSKRTSSDKCSVSSDVDRNCAFASSVVFGFLSPNYFFLSFSVGEFFIFRRQVNELCVSTGLGTRWYINLYTYIFCYFQNTTNAKKRSKSKKANASAKKIKAEEKVPSPAAASEPVTTATNNARSSKKSSNKRSKNEREGSKQKEKVSSLEWKW